MPLKQNFKSTDLDIQCSVCGKLSSFMSPELKPGQLLRCQRCGIVIAEYRNYKGEDRRRKEVLINCPVHGDHSYCKIGNPDCIPHRTEDVTKQPHYTQFKIQPLEFSGVNGLDFLQGNIVKYVCRYKMKNGVEDLKKAKHYLDCLIEREEKGAITL